MREASAAGTVAFPFRGDGLAIIAHAQRLNEGIVWDVDFAELAHALFARLLLL